jgi:hypothetical protein
MSTKQPIKLLFKQATEKCFVAPEKRTQKLVTWIENANKARTLTNLGSFENQYDKAEELITFYTFAPLVLSLDRLGLINSVLGLAGVSPFEEQVVDVGLERLFPPPEGYLRWIKKEVANHPIKYVREQATNHKSNQRLESDTHVDAYVETDKIHILFEMKYTSDIAYDTTFNPYRNQLARLADVGLELNQMTGKKTLVILSTPKKFFERRSRLYYYKIMEYNDPLKIKEDIEWRKNILTIQDNLLAIRWIALEDLIKVFYEDFNHEDKKDALEFFRERDLFIDNKF